jgi:thiol-disulfide isomerase/thioredoxin
MGKAIKIIFVLIVSVIFLKSPASGQTVKNIRTADLERILKNQDDKLHIVNFWATWCAPCVKELPYFEKLSKLYDPGKVSFILISLDFPSEVDKQLMPFLKRNKISLGVDLMQDLDYNSWIATVDQGWYGNLPATLVFNNSRNIRIFHSGEIDEPGLRKMIDENLK